MDILERFSKNLISIEYPKNKSSWNIAGVIKNQNGFYKFDVRDMFTLSDGTFAQTGRTDTKADKMVFDMKDQFIVVDTEELHKYLKENKLKDVHLQDLISKLEWNIILPK